MTTEEIFKIIADYYLSSPDFNGFPIRGFKLPKSILKKYLIKLIEAGDITLVFEEQHPNPHVKCLPPWPTEKQVTTLKNKADLTHVVAYPEGKRLLKTVKPQKYTGKPYTLRVARGMPSLNCAFFRLEVLEKFRNDPRFYYKHNDIVGTIYDQDEPGLTHYDRVYIKSIGFGYDKDLNRVVCCFYTDLKDLNREQQQYWKQFEVTGDYKPHPDFIKSQVYGIWPEFASLSEAFTEELKVINKITQLQFGVKLFRKTYDYDSRPKDLSLLIKPTSKELGQFISLMDKLISDNLNKKFFERYLSLYTEETQNGVVIKKDKGTLTLLEEFLRLRFKQTDPIPMEQAFVTFRKIRKLRQKPAHDVEVDKYDMIFFKKQRSLFIEAYKALRTLRLIFQNVPKADTSKIPEWLFKGKIWTR